MYWKAFKTKYDEIRGSHRLPWSLSMTGECHRSKYKAEVGKSFP